MPTKAIASPIKVIVMCQLCNSNVPKRSTYDFNENSYNCEIDTIKNAIKKFTCSVNNKCKQVICKKCHNKLLQYSSTVCVYCTKPVQRKSAMLFDVNKYNLNNDYVSSSLGNDATQCTSQYICKKCHETLAVKVVCTCCHRKIHCKSTVIFNKNKYDFEKDAVCALLTENKRYCAPNGKEYICKTCHNNLKIKDNREPRLPRVAVPSIKLNAGEKFLKAIDSKPEFVCTSCHRWLFRKSVEVFDEKHFNFNSSVVLNALSMQYRYKMYRSIHDNLNASQLPSTVSFHTCKYICKTCKRSLCQKKPKMPPQAVANGLQL